jgi:hypothetical protein
MFKIFQCFANTVIAVFIENVFGGVGWFVEATTYFTQPNARPTVHSIKPSPLTHFPITGLNKSFRTFL